MNNAKNNQIEKEGIKKVVSILEHKLVIFLTKYVVKKGSMFVFQEDDQNYFSIEIDNSKLAEWVFSRIKKLYEDSNYKEIHEYLIKLAEEE